MVGTDVVIEVEVGMDGVVVGWRRPSSWADSEAHAALTAVATVTMTTAALRAEGATT